MVNATYKTNNNKIINDAHMTEEVGRQANLIKDWRGGRPGKKLPDVVITIQAGGQDRFCYGTFQANKWARVDLETRELRLQDVKDDDGNAIGKTGTMHEISMKAEHFANASMVEIAAHIAHELVHLENCDLNIKDCSNGGAHNKKFKERAEEYGLIVTHGKEYGKSSKGWAYTEAGPEFIEFVETQIKPIVEAFDMARVPAPQKEKSLSTMQSLKCGCTVDEEGNKIGSTVSMSRGEVQRRIAKGTLPLDEECGQRFLPQD